MDGQVCKKKTNSAFACIVYDIIRHQPPVDLAMVAMDGNELLQYEIYYYSRLISVS